ncbi:DUF2634 domain-containing protein [Oceanirhabdus sp. W0125-5]|uniref:DUF2634 domain-containing protein n=1 Tax=Oceanirhabdus sp. W0125-5 TaxID=2999116 RepID=UPI0022F2B604|nr:DUF2634 domain-containing protein [Oceanirhabdus sp. W0125-5]WBW96044.1 DUF2634 domain-containing protein [Oceanirhabdus sp. W0125-5]
MSILPVFNREFVENINNVDVNKESIELPYPSEYDWDFEGGRFKYDKYNKCKIVTGNEAIKIWIYKMLKSERYKYLAYSWDYGQEFHDILSNGYTKQALEKIIPKHLKEALMINPYVKKVKNIKVILEDEKVNLDFDVITPYSEVKINV